MDGIFGVLLPPVLMFSCSGLGVVESALIKSYNKKHSNGGFFFIAMVSLASMLFFLFKYLILDGSKGDFDPMVIPYAIVAGLFYCSASVLTYYALCYGPLAISMLILSYSIVITLGYGIFFLGEDTNLLTYIALAIIAVSLFLVRGKDDGENKGVSMKWLITITLSVITSGMYGVVLRMQQIEFNNTVDNECMIIALGISALSLFIIGFIKSKKESLEILKSGAPYALAAGVANGANNMLSLFLNTIVTLTISVPTRSILKNIITFLYSYIVLKERFLPRQIVGIILGAIATVLLNIA